MLSLFDFIFEILRRNSNECCHGVVIEITAKHRRCLYVMSVFSCSNWRQVTRAKMMRPTSRFCIIISICFITSSIPGTSLSTILLLLYSVYSVFSVLTKNILQMQFGNNTNQPSWAITSITRTYTSNKKYLWLWPI